MPDAATKKVLRCDCGLAIFVVTEDDLVAEARSHAREAHHMEFAPDEVLALVRPDDGTNQGSVTPRNVRSTGT